MTVSVDEYHRTTSYNRFDLGGGGLDFGNQPRVFKRYPGRTTVRLPQVMAWPERNLSQVLRDEGDEEKPSGMDMDLLAKLIVLTQALTSKRRIAGAEFYFRSVASAGALYPFELYAATRGVYGLADGIYHHSLELHALTLLRSGNAMPHVAESVALGTEESPVAVFFLTSIFFRSSWKYRERAYRYNLLDTGHMAENLMLSLRSLGLRFRFFQDYDDRKVNSLLGVDEEREACLAVAGVWVGEAVETEEDAPLEEVSDTLPAASRVADRDTDHQMIREIHEATAVSSLSSREPQPVLTALGLERDPPEELPERVTWPEVMKYSDAIFKRRSNRNFVRARLPVRALVSLLDLLCVTHHEAEDARLIDFRSVAVGMLVGDVEDLDPGFYLLDRESRSVALVSPGPMLDAMTHICLDQQWLRNCSAHFLFMSNLKHVEKMWGPRGYRFSLMTAGALGQRIYVGATAMRVGCCGIGAFYDDEAASLLGLGEDSRLLYLVAVGPLRKWTLLGESG